MATALASNLRHSAFADVKIICADGSAWAHRLVLAAVSPVLRHLLLSVEQEDVATLYLPQLSKNHLLLVLDYVYKGRMYIKANQLQHVLSVIEVLSLECGVSVTKKVRKEPKDPWVEGGVFTSFTDKGVLQEVCKSLKRELEHVEHLDDDLNTLDELEEDAIEVKPELQRTENLANRSLRNSTVVDDDPDDYAVVEVECDDSDSDGDYSEGSDSQAGQHGSQHKCIMCSKVFMHAENLRIHIQSHLGAKAQLRSCQRCRKNFRTAIEHELHMVSHAYVTYLKKIKFEKEDSTSSTLSRNTQNKKSAGLKMARYLVRTSIKRLLPKKTLDTITTPKHLDDQPTVPIPIPLSQIKPIVPVNMKRIPKKTKKSSESAATENLKKVKKTITKRKKKSITMKNSSSKQRKSLLQTSSKELLKSTLCLENANGWQKLGMKPPGGQNLNLTASLNNPIPVFKASELDRNPIWQSCKLKIKIPLMKMNSEDLPTPQYSQKSPKKARKRKDSTKKAAASTSNHSSPTKQKAAKKGRKRKASNLHNTVESKAKKVKRSSLSESSPSSPALSAAAVAGWAASRSPSGWAGGSPAAGSSSPAGMSPRPPALKRKQSVEESLTCPTCDKLFIAKSILERHLKKSQHGMFEKDKDLNSPPPMVSLALDRARAEGQQLPHFNEITQPKIEVNGTEMNKYECHLCNKMFFRVKDLAKHRERMMCSAFAEYK